MRPGRILLLCATVAAGLAGYAVLSPSGLPKVRHKERELTSLRADVQRLEAENARLETAAARLQEGAPEAAIYLEDAAREELGWVKPDEHVLLLAHDTAAPDSAPAGALGVEGRTP